MLLLLPWERDVVTKAACVQSRVTFNQDLTVISQSNAYL